MTRQEALTQDNLNAQVDIELSIMNGEQDADN
jgi:hypothetical protein